MALDGNFCEVHSATPPPPEAIRNGVCRSEQSYDRWSAAPIRQLSAGGFRLPSAQELELSEESVVPDHPASRGTIAGVCYPQREDQYLVARHLTHEPCPMVGG